VNARTDVTIYEIGREETGKGLTDRTTLMVESHWNYRDRVVIHIGSEGPYTVVADDLRMAIENATNVRR
jgi:hypothetical protein